MSPEKKAHALARHLADYVLVWAGNQGDDLAKSPHMARISASVYSDLCPGDPLCRGFGFYAQGKPSESMAASMLYKMHSQGKVPGEQHGGGALALARGGFPRGKRFAGRVGGHAHTRTHPPRAQA